MPPFLFWLKSNQVNQGRGGSSRSLSMNKATHFLRSDNLPRMEILDIFLDITH